MTPNRPLFNVECPSCEAAFAVTDPNLVGEIVACPKCGGMILIEPPQNAREAQETRLPKDAQDDLVEPNRRDKQNDRETPDAQETQDVQKAASAQTRETARTEATPTPPPVCKRRAREEEKEEIAPPPKAAPPKYRPDRIRREKNRSDEESPNDENESTRKRTPEKKKIVLLVGGCALGALALGGAIYWGCAGSNDVKNAETGVESESGDEAPQDSATLPVAQNATDANDVDDALSRDEDEPSTFVGEFDPRGVEDLESATEPPTEDATAETTDETSESDDADKANGANGENGASEETEVDSLQNADKSDFNELNVDTKPTPEESPETAEPDETSNDAQPVEIDDGETQPNVPAAANDADKFDKNEQKYDVPNSKERSDADSGEDTQEEDLGEVASTTDLTFSSSLPTMKREIPKIDVDKRFSLRLKSLDCPKSPAATVRLLSEISGVPIAFDLNSFDLLRASTGTTLELKLANVEIGDALAKIAELLKWGIYKEENGVILRSLDAIDDVSVEERFEIADLVGGERDANADESLNEFVLPNNLTARDVAVFLRSSVAPESWETNGGKGTIVVDDANKALTIRQTAQNRKKITLLLDCLRAFRRGESSGANVAEIIPETLCWERTSKKIAFNLLEPTPLQNAIATLVKSQKGELDVVWDDAALNDAGVGRDSAVQIRVDSGSVDRILTDMLEPLGLTYLALSDRLIEITTRARAADYWTNEAFAPKKTTETKEPIATNDSNRVDDAVARRAEILVRLGIAEDDANETATQEEISASTPPTGAESGENVPVVWVDSRSGAAFVRQSQPNQRILRRVLEAEDQNDANKPTTAPAKTKKNAQTDSNGARETADADKK